MHTPSDSVTSAEPTAFVLPLQQIRYKDLAIAGGKGANLGELIAKQSGDMARIARCADGHDRFHLRDVGRGGEYCRTTQAMADQQRRRALRLPQIIGRSNQIGNVGRKIGIGKFSLAGAESGEIETQDGNAVIGQGLRNSAGGKNILPAREAMRK